MTQFPGSTFFWYLDATALIMTPSIAIHTQVLAPSRLESSILTNHPVVPPDSVIKTFGSMKGDRIDMVLSQDRDGLASSSFVVRNGEWAKFFLDTWFDPVYRTYNFQKAEAHALEHIVQYAVDFYLRIQLCSTNKTLQMARHRPRQSRNRPPGPAQFLRLRRCKPKSGHLRTRQSRRKFPVLRYPRPSLLQGAGEISRSS